MTEPQKRTPRKSGAQMIAEAKPSPGGARATAVKAQKETEESVGNIRTVPDVPTPTVQQRNVHELWCAVMESVRSVEKGDFNEQQGFKFRGVDAVVDAVGPALRRNGIHIRPRRILEHHTTEYTSRGGGRMVNRVVRIEWEVTGPQGDSFLGESMGEAADTGDKSLTKAQSVAYRVYLLQSLAIPTGDPDPDASSHERDTPAAREGHYWDQQQQSGYSRQRPAQPQDEVRQAQAGEENQAAPIDNEDARKEMWRVAKGLGWEWSKLAARFQADYSMETKHAPANVIEGFMKIILNEAEAEIDQAKAVVQSELGGREVMDEPPREPLL